MSRTDKQGIARSKKLQQASKKIKGISNQMFYIAISQKNIDKAKEDGDIFEIINPLGHKFYWYRRGRKSCFETRLKIDGDGYDRWGNIRYKLLKRLR